jgi:hypothetical protein
VGDWWWRGMSWRRSVDELAAAGRVMAASGGWWSCACAPR